MKRRQKNIFSIWRKGYRAILSSVVCILAALCSINSPAAEIASKPPSEYEVKAAYLFNFAKFVEWQPDAFTVENPSFIIGILGNDPFGSIIDNTVAGNMVNDKKFIIKRFKSSAEVDFCHILFISSSEESRIAETLEKVSRKGILTVGDAKSFLDSGGIINFVLVENKVRFEINLGAAEKAGLKISSKLLKLATLVKGNQPEGK
jgi:hypothetical protein